MLERLREHASHQLEIKDSQQLGQLLKNLFKSVEMDWQNSIRSNVIIVEDARILFK
jgi:hypothetical protein